MKFKIKLFNFKRSKTSWGYSLLLGHKLPTLSHSAPLNPCLCVSLSGWPSGTLSQWQLYAAGLGASSQCCVSSSLGTWSWDQKGLTKSRPGDFHLWVITRPWSWWKYTSTKAHAHQLIVWGLRPGSWELLWPLLVPMLKECSWEKTDNSGFEVSKGGVLVF